MTLIDLFFITNSIWRVYYIEIYSPGNLLTFLEVLKSPIVNCSSEIRNRESYVANMRVTIGRGHHQKNTQLQISECRLMINECRLLTCFHCHLSSGAIKFPPQIFYPRRHAGYTACRPECAGKLPKDTNARSSIRYSSGNGRAGLVDRSSHSRMNRNP